MPMYPDQIYRPTPKPSELPTQEVPRNLSDFVTEVYTNFKENSPFQLGVISET